MRERLIPQLRGWPLQHPLHNYPSNLGGSISQPVGASVQPLQELLYQAQGSGREDGLLLVRLWDLPGITSLPPQLEGGCKRAWGITQFKDRWQQGGCWGSGQAPVAPLGFLCMGQGHLSSPEPWWAGGQPSLQLLEQRWLWLTNQGQVQQELRNSWASVTAEFWKLGGFTLCMQLTVNSIGCGGHLYKQSHLSGYPQLLEVSFPPFSLLMFCDINPCNCMP